MPRRLQRASAPAESVGREVPVATGFRARLLGLACLDREEAGPGLLIPRCASVHTFGMRFALDLVFLDATGGVAVRRRGAAAPGRLVPRRGGGSGAAGRSRGRIRLAPA